MRPRTSKSSSARLSASVLALVGVVATGRAAWAQACCVAPSTTGLGRLAPAEDALVGVELRGTNGYGSFDRDGQFHASPRGAYDLGLEQNVFGTGRVLSRGQITATVPLVETFRGASGVSATGGGLGDLRVGLRWDALYARERSQFPGIGVLAGVILPTGTTPESSRGALGVGATGTGALQGYGGLAIEQTSGPWLGMVSGNVTLRAPRDVGGTTSALAPRWSLGLVGAHVWKSGFAVSAGTSFAYEGNASLDGRPVAGTERRTLQLSAGVQVPIGGQVRMIGSMFGAPPIPGISAGEVATVGLSWSLIAGVL